MNVFKILVSAVIASAIIYFILTTFVFKELDPNKTIESNINLAKESLGEPICSKISMKKNFELNPIIIKNNALFKPYNMELLYFNNSNSLKPINNYFVANQNISNLDFCSVCYPSFIFKNEANLVTNYDLICETIFASKISSININLESYDTVVQGFSKINFNGVLPPNYNYEVYIFDNQTNTNYTKINQAFFSSKIYSLEKEYLFFNNDGNIEFSNPGEKIVLQMVLPKTRSLNDFIGSGKVLINSVNVMHNSEYQSLNCKTTYSEKKYYDYDKQKCLQYNYCNDCILANHCVNAWNEKGLDSEAHNPNYSISYVDGEC